ncbi:MAG: alpha/beta fold hydrolase [Verrucomicrobiia bacterium]
MTTLIRLFLALACTAPHIAAPANSNPSVKLTRRVVEAADGTKLVCEVGGEGKVALLFLHGWCGDREYWKHQVNAFTPDFRVAIMDQAGHGESGKSRNQWSIAGLTDDVAAVVKALDLRRVILIGHSMGGPVALGAAKQMPDKVMAVIGVDTLQNAESKMRQDLASQILEGFTADFRGSMRAMIDGLLAEQTEPELKEWLASRAAAQDPKMALALMRDMLEVDVEPLWKEAKVPVRCINSSGGYTFFLPTASEINRKYADYKAVFIDNVGHYPMLEKPAEFNQRLHQVLDEVAKGR